MVARRTLWVFGQSHCLPFNLQDKTKGWDSLLANKLNYKLQNFAEPSSDNFFIFSTILQNINNIKKNDAVVVGWSDPSRKSFVFDKIQHKDIINNSIHYHTKKYRFIRSKGHPKASLKNSIQKFLYLKPKKSGIQYYDNWYKYYFSTTEQKINFQSYLISTKSILPTKNYIPFYFSKTSVDDIKNINKNFCVTEFIQKANVALAKNDTHMDYKGHFLWCDKLYKKFSSIM